MAERPILFSAPMVCALLSGTKTQTRRRMKLQPDDDAVIDIGELGTSRGVAYIGNSTSGGIRNRVPCPYGAPGDLLWVREACRAEELTTELALKMDKLPGQDGVRYLADNAWISIENSIAASDRWIDLNHYGGKRGGTVSPIHMPRWASRLTLRLTDVRVHRLQEISIADAIAEGIGTPLDDRYAVIDCFKPLWDSINGRGAWDTNPWVWALTFERSAPQ